MHEYSLCVALMRQVEQTAREHRAGKVERIVVQLGPLAGVEAALLERAWPLVAHATLAEGARLVIETAPVKVKCTRCGSISPAEPNRLLCAECGDYRTRLLSGDEMLLASLELSQLPPPAENFACA